MKIIFGLHFARPSQGFGHKAVRNIARADRPCESLLWESLFPCLGERILDRVQSPTRPRSRAAVGKGAAHGLTNALRFSIPLVSSTGRLILPKDLCLKHGVSRPRYLLSALGQGDASCQQALRLVVQDICTEARRDLELAREMRTAILDYDTAASHKAGKHAVAVFLPAVASETFLNRLKSKHYDLTDKNLRHTGLFDRFVGIACMVTAFHQDRF
jgi:hypothetical protein